MSRMAFRQPDPGVGTGSIRRQDHPAPFPKQFEERLAALRGRGDLLPVCSWCRKVRDEVGRWNPVAPHLLAAVDIPLTHGMCPECAKQFFPNRRDAA